MHPSLCLSLFAHTNTCFVIVLFVEVCMGVHYIVRLAFGATAAARCRAWLISGAELAVLNGPLKGLGL